jgi:hypothetical protein
LQCLARYVLMGSVFECSEVTAVPGSQLTEFGVSRYGVADRGASVRIPLPVSVAGKGYFEDRRPAANVNPYTVARLLLKSCFSN